MKREPLSELFKRLGRIGIVPGAHADDPSDRSEADRTTFRVIGRFFLTVYRESMRDKVPLRASGLTYASLLTLIPVLIIVFNLFQLFGGGEWFADMIRPFILANLAPGTGEQVATRLEEIVTQAGGATLNGIGVLVLVIAVWSIFSGIEGTVNAIWGTRSQAGSLKRIPLYWGLITIVPILMVGSLAITTYIQTMPFVSETVGQLGIAERLINRTLSAGLIIMGLFLLYWFVPNTPVRFRYAFSAAVICGLLYELLKSGFIFYTTHLVQYNVIYGSLAAIPMLLIWVNLSWILILSGVEMTFVQQHFPALINQSKGAKLSAPQQYAVAYRLLVDTTRAFQSDASAHRLHLDRWVDEQELPHGEVERAADLLVEGGFVERIGTTEQEIILALSPEQISLDQVDTVLIGEQGSGWPWPEGKRWQWLASWMEERTAAARQVGDMKTLAELVQQMGQKSEKEAS